MTSFGREMLEKFEIENRKMPVNDFIEKFESAIRIMPKDDFINFLEKFFGDVKSTSDFASLEVKKNKNKKKRNRNIRKDRRNYRDRNKK